MVRKVEWFGQPVDNCQWPTLARSSQFLARNLARLCQISPRHLRRCFRERFGCSTQAWLDEQRMLAAGPLLREKQCVKIVAYELGFKQVSHFSREFKKFHGLTPTAYLETHPRPPAAWPPRITDGREG